MSEKESVEKIKLVTSSGKEFVYENVQHLSCWIDNSFVCSRVVLEFYTYPSEPGSRRQAVPPSCSEYKYCQESTTDEEPPEWCPKRRGELFGDKENCE